MCVKWKQLQALTEARRERWIPPDLCLFKTGAGNGQHALLAAQPYFCSPNSNFIVMLLLSTSLHSSSHLLPLFLQELLMEYIADSDACFKLLQLTGEQHVSCSQELFTNFSFPQTLCLRISELFICYFKSYKGPQCLCIVPYYGDRNLKVSELTSNRARRQALETPVVRSTRNTVGLRRTVGLFFQCLEFYHSYAKKKKNRIMISVFKT